LFTHLSQDSKKKDAFKGNKSTVALPNATVRVKDFDPPCNDAPFKENCFQVVTTDGTTLSICAASEEEMQDWVEVIKSAAAGRRDLNKEVCEQCSLRTMPIMHTISTNLHCLGEF
jgi:hypothetical protein